MTVGIGKDIAIMATRKQGVHACWCEQKRGLACNCHLANRLIDANASVIRASAVSKEAIRRRLDMGWTRTAISRYFQIPISQVYDAIEKPKPDSKAKAVLPSGLRYL